MKISLLCALLCAACIPAPRPVPGADACALACDHGAELGCAFAQSTPNGASCTDVCLATEATGWSTMHPTCILRASTCADAERYSSEGCE